MGRCNLINFN